MTDVTAHCATAFGMAAVIACGLGLVAAAGAAPLVVPPLSGEALVQTVAGGCGPGYHPNPWGRPIGYGAYGYARPRPFYRPYGSTARATSSNTGGPRC